MKPTLLLGLAMLGLASISFAFASSVVVLDTARFIQGVGGACMWAAGMAWLMSAAPGGAARRADRRGAERRDRRRAARARAGRGGVACSAPRLVFSSVAVVAGGLAVWAWTMPGVEPEESPGIGAMLRALGRPAVLIGFWVFTLPALFSGVVEVLVPLQLDDLGAAGATIGAGVPPERGGGGGGEPDRGPLLRPRRAPGADPRRADRRGDHGDRAAASATRSCSWGCA